MASASTLYIPHPSARPGGRADFGALVIAPAGAVPRLDPLAPPTATLSLATSLIRVLDDDHRVVGPWEPHVDVDTLRAGLRSMLMTRLFDERMRRAHRQGEISFYMTSTGEEAVAVAQAMALRPTDMLFPSYRTQGLHVARDRSLVDLMCQCLSNTRDRCKGRQMPVFYHWKEGHIFSVSGNVATQVPQAVGWAMASALKGEDRIAAAWVGEGSTAEADCHHALTFASVYRAPAILNVVNNQWAISTCQAVAGGERQTFAARGPGSGLAGLRVDGNDFLAVYAVTQWAAERARAGGGATLIELVTYRAGAHSTSDDPARYRPRDEAAAWPLGDPIERLNQHLVSLGAWSEQQHAALAEELEAHVTACWREAVSYGTMSEGPRLDPATLFEDVFKELPEHLKRQRDELVRLNRSS